MLTSRSSFKILAFVALLALILLPLWRHLTGSVATISTGTQALSLYKIPDAVAKLVKKSDLIVRGRVHSTHSAWNAAHTLIETDNLLDVHYALFGDAPQQLNLHTLGGVLTDEDLGMYASDTVTFFPQEEVLLLLQKQGEHYQLMDHQLGQYYILNGIAADAHDASPMPVQNLVQLLTNALDKQGLRTRLPLDWQNRESQIAPQAGLSPQDFVYNGHKWPGASPVMKYKVNINTSQAGGVNGSVEDFRNAIIAAADTWSQAPNIDFKFQYDGATSATTVGPKNPGLNGMNEIVFMHQGITNTAGLGIYYYKQSDNSLIEGDIWLNDDLAWDATGAPATDELDLQSGVLHELGHLLSLGHTPDESAIMFPSLDAGILKRTLSPVDQAGIQFIYPCNDPACQTVVPTATPTLTPSSTATATSTPLPGSTATATPSTTPTVTPSTTPSDAPSATPTIIASSESKAYLPLVQK